MGDSVLLGGGVVKTEMPPVRFDSVGAVLDDLRGVLEGQDGVVHLMLEPAGGGGWVVQGLIQKPVEEAVAAGPVPVEDLPAGQVGEASRFPQPAPPSVVG